MSDHLKKIWSGFEQQTSRKLTGTGIDNIHVPDRREWRSTDNKFLPQDFEAPAERAFAALSWKLSEEEKRLAKKAKKRQSKYDDATRFAYGNPEGRETRQYTAEGDPRQALLASLKETDFRVLRREINYLDSGGASATEDMLKRKPKKKFLGLFGGQGRK